MEMTPLLLEDFLHIALYSNYLVQYKSGLRNVDFELLLTYIF